MLVDLHVAALINQMFFEDDLQRPHRRQDDPRIEERFLSVWIQPAYLTRGPTTSLQEGLIECHVPLKLLRKQ